MASLYSKKHLFLVLFFSLIFSGIFAASVGDYRSLAAGNWSNTATWQRFNTPGVWGAAPSAPTNASLVITITHAVIVDANYSVDQVIVNSGGSITINSGITLTVADNGSAAVDLQVNTGATVTNNGFLTLAVAAASMDIANGGTFSNTGTVTNPGTFSNNCISFTNSGTFTNSGSLTNALNKTIVNSGTINNSGTFTNISTAVANSITNTGTINNSGTLSSASTTANVFINNSPAIIINSGTITTGGATTFIFNTGTYYKHNFSSAAAANGTIPTATYNTGSTVEIQACGLTTAPAGMNQTFGNFIWNNTTQPANMDMLAKPNTLTGDFEIKSTFNSQLIYKSGIAGGISVGDSMKVSGGTFVLASAASPTTITVTNAYYQTGGVVDLSSSTGIGNGYIYIGKDFKHTGGTVKKSGSGAAACEIRMNGTSASTIESTSGFNSGDAIAFNILKTGGATCTINVGKLFTINNGTTFTVTDNTTSASDLIVDGTLVTNTNTWSLSSGVTSVDSLFLNNSTTIGTSSATTLIFNGGSTFRQAADGGTIPTATWAASSTLEVTGTIAATTLAGGGQSFGKINWNSTAQTSSCDFGTTSFGTQSNYTVTYTGTGTLRFPDVDFIIGGDLTVKNTSKLQLANAQGLFTPATRNITVQGNVVISGTASMSVGQPNTTGIASGVTNRYRDYNLGMYKDYTNSSTSPTALTSFDQVTFGGTTTNESYHMVFNFYGGITQNYTATYLSGNLIAGSLLNEFISNNAYSINVSSNSTLMGLSDMKYKVLIVNSGSTLDMTSGTYNLIQYSAITSANATDAAWTTISGTLNFGYGQLTDALGTTGNFTLTNAGTAELRTKHTGGIATSGATGCIQSSSRSYGAAANYTYNGSTAQITGTGLPGTLTGTLKIANTTALATGGVTLTNPTTMSSATGILNLTTGKLITTSGNLMSINSTGSVTPAGGSATSFVDGPIKKTGFTANTEYVFPTGNSTKWARIGITIAAPVALDAFTAQYFKTNPKVAIDTTCNHTVSGRELTKISSVEYWDLAKTGGTNSGKVKLYYEDANFSGITSAVATDLRVAHYTNAYFAGASKWYGESAATPYVVITTSGITGTVESNTTMTTFSPFTFGSRNSNNPLPIELLSFSGNAMTSGNQLNWETATETNNDYFDLERSGNGDEFAKIAQVDGAGNSTSKNDYDYLDTNPLNGTNYYRLKQVDFNGDYTYSNIIAIDNKIEENTSLVVFPNPTSENTINIAISDNINFITIYNILGEVLYQNSTISTETKAFTIDVLSAGVYIVKATTKDHKVITSRFTKK